MKKNKIELIDQDSYYRGFKNWLDSSNSTYDLKDEFQMNEMWLKFADEVGIYLGKVLENEKIIAEIIDSDSWKEAKKFYSIMAFKTASVEESLV
jgi:hypothetical protein